MNDLFVTYENGLENNLYIVGSKMELQNYNEEDSIYIDVSSLSVLSSDQTTSNGFVVGSRNKVGTSCAGILGYLYYKVYTYIVCILFREN